MKPTFSLPIVLIILLGLTIKCTHPSTILDLQIEQSQKMFEIEWTAYKYSTDRAAVSGTFDEIEIVNIGEYEESNPLSFLENGAFEVQTNSANIGDNNERNNNIRNYFFRYMAPLIKGNVTHINGDTISVNLEMNFIEKPIDFIATTINDSIIILEGSIIDMNEFNWITAHDNLQRVCGEYHRDYIWKDIDLKAKFYLPQ